MDYAKLKAEIVGDPLTHGYAGMADDAAVAASLNAVDRAAPVPAKDIRRYLDLVDLWANIAYVALGNGTAAEVKAALAMKGATEAYDDFDLSVPEYLGAITAKLDQCVAAGLIQAADKTAILALGDNRRSRAAEIGVGAVRAADVTTARTY